MNQFAVVHIDEDFVQCVGIYTDYFRAVDRAYDYASDLTTGAEGGEVGVTPLFDLEGQTGVGLTVRYGTNLKANIFILSHEAEKENPE